MSIGFSYDYIETSKFENLFEEELQIDREVRKDIINAGIVVYITHKGRVIGESYGISPADLKWTVGEDTEDVMDSDDESIYVCSTAILPNFQGLGYGNTLIQEFSSHASDCGYVKVLGHATTQRMVDARKKRGAIFRKGAVHGKWYGTERTAHFYTEFLTQNKDYNCGPMSLAYLLERKGHSFLVEDLEHMLKTTEESGTCPESMESFLSEIGVEYKIPKKDLMPNSIIDITVDGDGHWVVLNEQDSTTGDWLGYDPDRGYVTFDNEYLKTNWVSPRYGKCRGLYLT